MDSTTGVNAYHFDQDESRKELAYMIILHKYPLSIVDHIGFRRYSTSLQPLFKMVCRNTIKKEIMRIYDHEREKSMHEIEKNRSRIAITTDMWTSQHKRRGFMVAMAYFIDDFWRSQSQVMRFIYVSSPHTKEVLSDVLLQTLLEWNIDRKLSTMTVDNCNGLNVIGSCIEKVCESVGFWTGLTKRRQRFTDMAQ
ncbi:zinc finger BED domain-containing protein RICESLEEPER 3-like [Quercus robur]|uniref:zinc finger BED domain-containing protein RICESLEEPER 3-like n=1 Tax=Quercus robur TaxID=38942 RepID=UPI0021618047|nr:zinc finger BED domain-containing protein RICESLEEPER 3-like [Quercus robur]